MLRGTAETTNVRALSLALNALGDRQERIAVVSGKSGMGKTTALIHSQNTTNGVVITASPTWSPKWMLTSLCEELSLRPSHSSQAMFEAIVRQLKQCNRPIFLDESNFVVECLESRTILGILGTLYRIHDAANVPIILFGLSSFPRYLRDRASRNETVEAFSQRVVQWVDFCPCGLEDARLVAQKRCEVQVGEKLLEALVGRVEGSFRKLIAELTEIERDAKAQGWTSIDLPQLEALRKRRAA